MQDLHTKSNELILKYLNSKEAKVNRFNSIKRKLKSFQLTKEERAILNLVLSTYADDFEFSGNDLEFQIHISKHYNAVKNALYNN